MLPTRLSYRKDSYIPKIRLEIYNKPFSLVKKKTIEQTADKNGINFTYVLENSTDDGDAIINDLRLIDSKNKSTIAIDKLLVSKAVKIGENGFSFEGLVANSLSVKIKDGEADETKLAMENLSFSNVEYPDLSERPHLFWPVNINAAEIKNLKADVKSKGDNVAFNLPSVSLAELKHNGGEAFSISNFVTSPMSGDFTGEKGASFTFSFEGITLTDAKYLGELAGRIGILNVSALAAAGVTPEKETVQFDFAGFKSQNIYLPGTNEDRPFVSPDPITVNVGALKLALAGNNVMGWDGADGSSVFDPSTKILETIGGWKNLFIDLSKIPMNAEQKINLQPMFDLGYEKLSMDMDYSGIWNIETGLVDISKFGFAMKDAFVFDMNINFSGYTEALARQIRNLSNQLQFANDPKQQQAMGLQMFALMSGLTINEMSIELEDRSLLNKVIEYQAGKQNQDAEQLRGIAGPMVGILLAPFKIPEFANNLSGALSTFMQGNKSITLALKPSPPAGVAEIVALSSGINTGRTTPAEIIERFNVTVEAE